MPPSLFPQMAHQDFGGGPTTGAGPWQCCSQPSRWVPWWAGCSPGWVSLAWSGRGWRSWCASGVCRWRWRGSRCSSPMVRGGRVLPPGPRRAGRRRCRRHGVRGVPDDDTAVGRRRCGAWSVAGVFIVVVAGGPRLADISHGWAAAVAGTTSRDSWRRGGRRGVDDRRGDRRAGVRALSSRPERRCLTRTFRQSRLDRRWIHESVMGFARMRTAFPTKLA